jgi:hypothetical protein
MGAVRRPCPQPQQRIVCIRSEEPPKNRARFLGLIGQSSWRYLPDYTRHLWLIKDDLGTATWLVKGPPEGPGTINRAVSEVFAGYRPCDRESCEPGMAIEPAGSVASTAPLFEIFWSDGRAAIAEEGISKCCSVLRFLG